MNDTLSSDHLAVPQDSSDWRGQDVSDVASEVGVELDLPKSGVCAVVLLVHVGAIAVAPLAVAGR
jgi:hypothetical protein